MLFTFLKYVQPIWYYNLKPAGDIPYWIDFRKLAPEEQELIRLDTHMRSTEAQWRDAAYQAWQKGLIKSDSSLQLELIDVDIPIEDEYRFLKKYFHGIWSFYVLLLRLISLRNPLRECRAWLRSLPVQRVDVYKEYHHHNDYENFRSPLLERSPKVTVIIPTLNRYKYLDDVIKDLEAQTYKNFETIVVDQSSPLKREFYENRTIAINLICQEEKALWKARNNAIKASSGEYILLFDDDSRVEPDWIEHHVKTIDFFDADISAGVSLSVVGAKIPRHYSYFRWSDQFDTGNAMVNRRIFTELGLFDRQFERQRMGDGEFGLRAYLAGKRNVSNPFSKRIHLKVEQGGLRQMGSWDGYRPTKVMAPRPVPSVLYLTRKYFGRRQAIMNIIIKVPASVLPLRFKNKPALMLIASLFSLLIMPFIAVQVIRSWNLSSRMIRQGALIEKM